MNSKWDKYFRAPFSEFQQMGYFLLHIWTPIFLLWSVSVTDCSFQLLTLKIKPLIRFHLCQMTYSFFFSVNEHTSAIHFCKVSKPNFNPTYQNNFVEKSLTKTNYCNQYINVSCTSVHHTKQGHGTVAQRCPELLTSVWIQVPFSVLVTSATSILWSLPVF